MLLTYFLLGGGDMQGFVHPKIKTRTPEACRRREGGGKVFILLPFKNE